jgi:hypothetical protein
MIGLRNRIGSKAVAIALGVTTLLIAEAGPALAHPEGGMVGRHSMPTEPGATCIYNSAQQLEVYVKPPTIYATPYDSRSGQYVAWQARLVRYYGGQSATVSSSWSGPKLAPEGGTAAFTRIGPLWGRADSAAYYVFIDFYFYHTGTGLLTSSSTNWVRQYERIGYNSSGQTISYPANSCWGA